MNLRSLDAQAVAALGPDRAREALRRVLADGFDPDDDPPRASVPFGAGELLLMPSTAGDRAGVKLATVAPDDPARNTPRIHAVYLLFDARTLAPRALLDGAALTTLRTPAVGALGADLVAPADADSLLVFGTGPQGRGHVEALRAVRPVRTVGVVGRDRDRTTAFVAALRHDGIDAHEAVATDVGSASIVACCTTARTPLFDGRALGAEAVVVACGSHERDAREVDTETVRRCGGALVESHASAAAEAGDVVAARAEGPVEVVTLAEVVTGRVAARPRFVKTVGMAWEDLAVAAAVVDARGDIA